MSKFIYASELKKTYRCYGHFYRLLCADQEPVLCRSVLEITSLPRDAVGAGTDSNDLFSQVAKPSLPDAIIVMMNPGSSRPLEDGDSDSLLSMPLEKGFQKPRLLTQPDNTQYQIMRIMSSQGWSHVRVLNISDIRQPKSPLFIAQTQKMAEWADGETHSLFCEQRSDERAEMLKRKPNAPFITGWGQDLGLLPLAEQCLQHIEGERQVTVPSPNHPKLTAHPSPMMQEKKEQWLKDICAALKKSAS